MTPAARVQSRAEARAHRHAKTFMASQLPPSDPHVFRLADEGYVPLQIAMIARLPIIDVRLMLAGRKP